MFVVFIFRIVRAFWVYDFSKFSIRKYSKYSTTAKKRGHFTVFWTFSGVFVNIITDIWRALFSKKLAFFCANLGYFLNRLIYSSHSDKRGPMNVWVFERFLLHSHLQKRFRANVILLSVPMWPLFAKSMLNVWKIESFLFAGCFCTLCWFCEKITIMSPLKLSTFQLGQQWFHPEGLFFLLRFLHMQWGRCKKRWTSGTHSCFPPPTLF